MAPSGLVQGPGAEETLSRAAYYLERGRLADTLRELDSVEGYSQVLMQDWKALANAGIRQQHHEAWTALVSKRGAVPACK